MVIVAPVLEDITAGPIDNCWFQHPEISIDGVNNGTFRYGRWVIHRFIHVIRFARGQPFTDQLTDTERLGRWIATEAGSAGKGGEWAHLNQVELAFLIHRKLNIHRAAKQVFQLHHMALELLGDALGQLFCRWPFVFLFGESFGGFFQGEVGSNVSRAPLDGIGTVTLNLVAVRFERIGTRDCSPRLPRCVFNLEGVVL